MTEDTENDRGAAWRPHDPLRGLRLTSRLGVVVAVTILIDAVVLPPESASGQRGPLLFAALAALLVAAFAAANVRRPDRYLPRETAVVVVDMVTITATSGFIVWLGGLPPGMMIYALSVIQTTFGYPPRGRLAINGLTLVFAGTVSLIVQPGVGNTVLALGFLGAVGFIAEVRMRDLESAARDRSVAAETAGRRAAAVLGSARLRLLDRDRILDELLGALQSVDFEHIGVAEVRDGMRRVVRTTDAVAMTYPPVPMHAGLGGQCVTERRTIVVANYDDYPDSLPGRMSDRSVAAVPLLVFDEVVGVVSVSRPRAVGLPAADVEVVEVIALHAGVALENAAVFDREHALVTRLIEVDRLRDDLLSNVSHELRTPLHAIGGLGETLARLDQPMASEQAQLLVSRMNVNADRMRDRIELLLAHARFEPGHRISEPSDVDIRLLADEVIERIGPLLAGSTVAVRRVGDGHTVALADSRSLEHVLENLLMNAVHHANADHITVELEGRSDGVHVTVSDDGRGLQPDDVDRITERGVRGTGAETHSGEGLGLGLSLATGILRQHGTELQVSNLATGGASFSFRLDASSSVGARSGS